MTKRLSITPCRCHPEHREGSMQLACTSKLPVRFEGARLQPRRQAV